MEYVTRALDGHLALRTNYDEMGILELDLHRIAMSERSFSRGASLHGLSYVKLGLKGANQPFELRRWIETGHF